jgi:anti-sigma B factor antagonist
LSFSAEPQGKVLVITVTGDLDITTVGRLDESLSAGRASHRHIVLDMSAVEFMDTSSLAVIVGHWNKLRRRGGTLALAGARYRATKTLWVTGLAERLAMYDTVAEAVAAAEGGRAAVRPEER